MLESGIRIRNPQKIRIQSWIFKCVAVGVAVAVAVVMAVVVVVVVVIVIVVAVAVAVVVATVLLIKHGFLNDFTEVQCRLS